MPKNSRPRLFSTFLSASLLLGTAGSALAQTTSNASKTVALKAQIPQLAYPPNTDVAKVKSLQGRVSGSHDLLEGQAQQLEAQQQLQSAQPLQSLRPIPSAQPVPPAQPSQSAQPLQSLRPIPSAQPVPPVQPMQQPHALTVAQQQLLQQHQPGTTNSQTQLKPQQLAMAFSPAVGQALRTPVMFIDDLTESALHLLKTAPAQTPGAMSNMGKSVRNFVPSYFDYRPARAAAQAFLGDARLAPQTSQTGANGETNSQSSIQNNSVKAETKKPLAIQYDGKPDTEAASRNKLALTLTAAMMQIAKGLGETDTKVADTCIQHGRARLAQLLGKGQADWVMNKMTAWAETVKSDCNQFADPVEADILDQEDAVNELVSKAVSRDSQINNLKAAIGVHDRAPTGAERGLTLAALTPNLIGPAANLAQYAVERGTGGTRSKRLDDVLTMGITMQERVNLLTRESELAISNLERAKASKNDILYFFSKDLMAKLGGPK